MLAWIEGKEPFPPVERALKNPNGLLAAGGELSTERLLAAYRSGVFPWYSGEEPILWWSPDPRMVLFCDELKVSRSLAKNIRNKGFEIRIDSAFARVVKACSEPRKGEGGTWLTPAMQAAYAALHRLGHAHSVETWQGERLVGGLYGVAIGRMFYGESMFSAATNGSKVALLALCRAMRDWGWPLLDAQVASDHLFTLGAREMQRADFCAAVDALVRLPGCDGAWREGFPRLDPADLAS